MDMGRDSESEQKKENLSLDAQNAIIQATTSSLVLNEILSHTLQQILGKLKPDKGAIYLLNRETETLRLAQQIGFPPETTRVIKELDLQESVALQRPQRGSGITILPPEAYSPPRRRAFEQNGLKTIVGVPLWARGGIMGVALLGSTASWELDEDESRFLAFLGRQIGNAIDNSLLYQMAQRRVEELSMLHRVGQTLTASLEPDEVITAILKETRTVLRVTGCSIALLDEERQELTFTTAVGGAGEEMPGMRLALGQGVAGWVAQKGEPLLVHDAQSDPRFFGGIDRETGFVTRSVLCVPLSFKEKIIGVIEVVNKIDGYFDEEDIRLLTSLATSAAVAIENSHLYQQQKETALQLAARNEALLETQRKLVWAERMATIGKIGLAIRRELDRPLTIILRNAEVLLSADYLPLDARQRLEDIARKSIQIGDIIKKLQREEEI